MDPLSVAAAFLNAQTYEHLVIAQTEVALPRDSGSEIRIRDLLQAQMENNG